MWQLYGKQVKNLALASRVLDIELALSGNENELNIERLLTRARAPLPFDDEKQAVYELGILRNAVLDAFRKRLDDAKPRNEPAAAMHGIAGYCLQNGVNCITFNYDDFLDQALFEQMRRRSQTLPFWNPTIGYGFSTLHSVRPDTTYSLNRGHLACRLLKLHGSVNWRVPRGARSPYRITDFTHDSLWFPDVMPSNNPMRLDAERALEREPFIVPPVLSKTEFLAEPLLQVVWQQAFDCLVEADEVTFIGYAMAEADIAARSLFSEALAENSSCLIIVVNTGRGEALENRYSTVLGSSRGTLWPLMGAKESDTHHLVANAQDTE